MSKHAQFGHATVCLGHLVTSHKRLDLRGQVNKMSKKDFYYNLVADADNTIGGTDVDIRLAVQLGYYWSNDRSLRKVCAVALLLTN